VQLDCFRTAISLFGLRLHLRLKPAYFRAQLGLFGPQPIYGKLPLNQLRVKPAYFCAQVVLFGLSLLHIRLCGEPDRFRAAISFFGLRFHLCVELVYFCAQLGKFCLGLAGSFGIALREPIPGFCPSPVGRHIDSAGFHKREQESLFREGQAAEQLTDG